MRPATCFTPCSSARSPRASSALNGDVPQSVLDSGEAVRIEAFADMGKGMESLTPSIFAEILAASTGDAVNGVMLDVRDYGEVRAADVKKFRR